MQALALTLFSALARLPDAQSCHAGCCSQAVRWELSTESCFTEVAFLYVEFEWIQGSRQCRLECVCCPPAGGKKENEGKNYWDFLSFVLTVETAWQQNTHASGLTKQEVDLWETEGSFSVWILAAVSEKHGRVAGPSKAPFEWVESREPAFLRIRVCKKHRNLGYACLRTTFSIFACTSHRLLGALPTV